MSDGEVLILLRAVKEGEEGVHGVFGLYGLLQQLKGLVKRPLHVVGGAQGGAHSGKAVAVGGEDGVLLIQL